MAVLLQGNGLFFKLPNNGEPLCCCYVQYLDMQLDCTATVDHHLRAPAGDADDAESITSNHQIERIVDIWIC